MHWEILFMWGILFTELLLEWEVDKNLFTLSRLARRGDKNEDWDSRCRQGDTKTTFAATDTHRQSIPPHSTRHWWLYLWLVSVINSEEEGKWLEGAGGRNGLRLTSIWNPNGFSVQMDRECVWNQSSKGKDIGTISALVQFCSIFVIL